MRRAGLTGGQLTKPARQAVPVESFADDLRRVCGQFGVDPGRAAAGRVHGSVTTRMLSRFDTAIVALDAERVRRDARMIRADPGEHLFLLIQDQGSCRIEQGGRATELGHGDMFLADSTRPSDFVYGAEGSSQISIHLPRDEGVRRFGAICTGGIGINRDDPLATAMQAVLWKLMAEDHAVAAPLGEALMSLLGAYFRCVENRTSLAGRPADRLLAAAVQAIEEGAPHPDFDMDHLVDRLGVSRRTLQRRFEALGETVSGRILRARLDLAWSRLSSAGPDPRQTSVAAIAFDAGFNDLSYFYRAFRSRFGSAPGAVRRGAGLAR